MSTCFSPSVLDQATGPECVRNAPAFTLSSNCLQKNTFEVFGFRDRQEYRVIRGLGSGFDHTDPSSGQPCRLRQEIAKHFSSHVIRAGTGDEIPSFPEEFHGTAVYGQIPFF